MTFFPTWLATCSLREYEEAGTVVSESFNSTTPRVSGIIDTGKILKVSLLLHATKRVLLLLLYFPLGYPKGNGPKARGSPGEKEMKTIVKNEDEW